MEQIKNEAMHIARFLLQNPQSPTEQNISAVVAVLVCAWIFLKVGDRMDMPNVGILTAFVYTGLGLAAVIFGIAAGHIYLVKWYQQLGPMLFDISLAVLISLAVVVPIINNFTNGKYMGTLAAWAISTISALAAVAFLVNIYAFIDSGGRALQRGAQHNEATKQMLR